MKLRAISTGRAKQRSFGAQLGTTVGDTVSQLYMYIFESLWLEPSVGDLEPRRAIARAMEIVMGLGFLLH
ncbi:hypothetical protein Scep_002530 [Stephania cephalantha]|uniref:Uncharacterized protein n=1 Tax=Stephania cephalantha TaxID=152367 RepID=A0AAP0LE56_9MAGN